jgi:hypothetical protein
MNGRRDERISWDEGESVSGEECVELEDMVVVRLSSGKEQVSSPLGERPAGLEMLTIAPLRHFIQKQNVFNLYRQAIRASRGRFILFFLFHIQPMQPFPTPALEKRPSPGSEPNSNGTGI